MAKRQSEPGDSRHEVMEVHGFDLLSQVEALLRHVREYQREVQRWRGILGKGQTTTSHRQPEDAVREHVKRLRVGCATLGETVDELEQVLGPVNRSKRRKAHDQGNNAR